jgi:very-short-patch-repair endonuclease
MLNLSPDHLDRHGDMAGYIAAKRAIFDRQEAYDLAVVGVDDAESRAMAAWLRGRPAQVVTITGKTKPEAAEIAEVEVRSPPPLEGGGWGEGCVQPPSPQVSLLPYARRMRHAPTPAERKLWQALRKRQASGFKFRRQMPLGPFIADFYCAASQLVVELDGISHIDSQTDAERDAWMQERGIRVVRYSNHEVLSNCEGVCLAIEQFATSTPPPGPLPHGEGETLLPNSLPNASSLSLHASSLSLPLANAPALPGQHNAQNAAAAYAIARFLGVPHVTIEQALTTFPGLPHRQQRLRTIDGITFINDSKATNADAAASALSCYDRVVWIAGGLAKQGGIEPLASFFPRIVHTLLIGRDAPMLAATLAAHNVPHEIAGTLDAATPRAFAAARASGAPVVLLSPACASFDQFSGFDARGDRFADLVASLAQERAA